MEQQSSVVFKPDDLVHRQERLPATLAGRVGDMPKPLFQPPGGTEIDTRQIDLSLQPIEGGLGIMGAVAGLELGEGLEEQPEADAVFAGSGGKDVEVRDGQMAKLVEQEINQPCPGLEAGQQMAEEIGIEEVQQELIVGHALLADHDVKGGLVVPQLLEIDGACGRQAGDGGAADGAKGSIRCAQEGQHGLLITGNKTLVASKRNRGGLCGVHDETVDTAKVASLAKLTRLGKVGTEVGQQVFDAGEMDMVRAPEIVETLDHDPDDLLRRGIPKGVLLRTRQG